MLYIFTQLNTVTTAIYEKWLSEAPAQRQDYILRYKLYKDRLLSVCSYRLLCCALKRDVVLFKFNEHGKPRLIDDARAFSMSHCEGCVAVCVSEGNNGEVGVDVEPVRPYPVNVARRVLTQKETEQIKNSTRPDVTFFKLWTLKESYVKAIGKGLSFPFKGVEFILSDDVIKCSDTDYCFQAHQIGRHILSACEKERSALKAVELDELLY